MVEQVKKTGTRRQLVSTVLGILALIVAIVAGSLIWRHISRERTTLSPDGFLSLNGYQSIEMMGDTCCLVDGSGVVYSLDLATGATKMLFNSPVNVSWVAAPTLDVLYYFDKQVLYETDTATGETRQLLDMTEPETARGLLYDRSRRVLAVADHYLLYQANHLTGDEANPETCDFYILDIQTLESRLILSEKTSFFSSFFQFGTGRDFLVRGDTVYTVRVDRSTGQMESYLTALDMTTGEFNDLVMPESGVLFFSITEDRLLYVCDGQDALYQVPLTGGESKVLTRLPVGDNIFLSCFSEDGILFGIADYTEYGTPFTLYSLDTDTGEYTELRRFTNNFLGGHTLVTDGMYYGVVGSLNNKEQLFLGKLP